MTANAALVLTPATHAAIGALGVHVSVEDRGSVTRITVKGRDANDVRAAKKLLVSAGIAGKHLSVDGCKVWSKGHYAEANSAGTMRKLWDVYHAGIEVA